MKYAPKNCLKCGGKPKYQKGGSFGSASASASARKAGLNTFTSVVDYLDEAGMNSSYGNRESYFYDLFGNSKKYTGSAKQNLSMIQAMENDKKYQNRKKVVYNKSAKPTPPAYTPVNQSAANTLGFKTTDATTGVAYTVSPKTQKVAKAAVKGNAVSASAKASPAPVNNPLTMLQSGVVTDKGKNVQYLIQNGKVVKSFPILTGEASNQNINTFSLDELENDKSKRGTPVGDYFLKPNSNLYGRPGFNQRPIADKQGFAPAASITAMHYMYDPENRAKLFNMSPDKRYASYGCTNLRGEDIACTTNMFPKGDTLTVADSRTGIGRKVLSQYGVKRMGGFAKMQKGGCTDAIGNSVPCEGEGLKGSSGMTWQNPSTETPVNPDATTDPAYTTQIKEKGEKSSYDVHPIKQKNNGDWVIKGDGKVDPFKLGLGLEGTVAGLSWVGEMFNRKNQNKYKGSNLSTLGRFESQPNSNSQQSPYNLYAQKGGEIPPIYVQSKNHPRLKAYADSTMRANRDLDMMNIDGTPYTPYPKQEVRYKPSVVDYLDEAGMNSSYGNRESYFYDLLGTSKKYTGSTKQNLSMIQAMENDPSFFSIEGGVDLPTLGAPNKNSYFPNPFPQPKRMQRGGMIHRNPYDAYMRLGGNIKKYMFTNEAENPAFPTNNGRMQLGGTGCPKGFEISQMTGDCVPVGQSSENPGGSLSPSSPQNPLNNFSNFQSSDRTKGFNAGINLAKDGQYNLGYNISGNPRTGLVNALNLKFPSLFGKQQGLDISGTLSRNSFRGSANAVFPFLKGTMTTGVNYSTPIRADDNPKQYFDMMSNNSRVTPTIKYTKVLGKDKKGPTLNINAQGTFEDGGITEEEMQYGGNLGQPLIPFESMRNIRKMKFDRRGNIRKAKFFRNGDDTDVSSSYDITPLQSSMQQYGNPFGRLLNLSGANNQSPIWQDLGLQMKRGGRRK